MSAAVLARSAEPKPVSGLMSLLRSLLINVLGSWLAYVALERLFPAPSMVPLWGSAAIPTADLLWELWKRRQIDVVAVISLSQMTAAISISLLAHTPHASMVGHAWQAAALGLVFAGSVVLGRPLMAPLARQAMAGDDPVRQARFDATLASLPALRRQLTWISLAWTFALCAETGVRLLILSRTAPATYLLIAGVLSWAVPSVLGLASLRYGRWMARRVREQARLAPESSAS
ncbi:MAG: VC0807 family protein [Caulobacteraceae bacterium]